MPGQFTIQMITVDCLDPGRLGAFWSAATGRPIVADYDAFVMVGTTPTLGFQRVDDPTPGKNRIHLDVHVDEREQTVARLVELGATEHDTRTCPRPVWNGR